MVYATVVINIHFPREIVSRWFGPQYSWFVYTSQHSAPSAILQMFLFYPGFRKLTKPKAWGTTSGKWFHFICKLISWEAIPTDPDAE